MEQGSIEIHATTVKKSYTNKTETKDKLRRLLPLNTRSGTYYVACYRLTHAAEFTANARKIKTSCSHNTKTYINYR